MEAMRWIAWVGLVGNAGVVGLGIYRNDTVAVTVAGATIAAFSIWLAITRRDP